MRLDRDYGPTTKEGHPFGCTHRGDHARLGHDALIVDDSNLIRDLLTSEVEIVRTVWIRMPWSSQGRWAGAVYSDLQTNSDRNIWTLDGKNSLLEVLASFSSPTGSV